MEMSHHISLNLSVNGVHDKLNVKCQSYICVFLSLCNAKQTRGAQGFTIFLQVFSEDIAGLSSLGGVVQRNVSIDVLQQNIHPRLPDAGQEKAEKTQTN